MVGLALAIVAAILGVRMIADPSPSPSLLADYDVPPKIVKLTKPVYPKEPFRAGVQGTVLIEFVVDETGSVRNPTITQSVPGLDEAALTRVKQWRFTPAQKRGRTRSHPRAGSRHVPDNGKEEEDAVRMIGEALCEVTSCRRRSAPA